MPIRIHAAKRASARLIAILGIENERMNLIPKYRGCA
jgi:hypothetical protein